MAVISPRPPPPSHKIICSWSRRHRAAVFCSLYTQTARFIYKNTLLSPTLFIFYSTHFESSMVKKHVFAASAKHTAIFTVDSFNFVNVARQSVARKIFTAKNSGSTPATRLAPKMLSINWSYQRYPLSCNPRSRGITSPGYGALSPSNISNEVSVWYTRRFHPSGRSERGVLSRAHVRFAYRSISGWRGAPRMRGRSICTAGWKRSPIQPRSPKTGCNCRPKANARSF